MPIIVRVSLYSDVEVYWRMIKESLQLTFWYWNHWKMLMWSPSIARRNQKVQFMGEKRHLSEKVKISKRTPWFGLVMGLNTRSQVPRLDLLHATQVWSNFQKLVIQLNRSSVINWTVFFRYYCKYLDCKKKQTAILLNNLFPLLV